MINLFCDITYLPTSRSPSLTASCWHRLTILCISALRKATSFLSDPITAFVPKKSDRDTREIR